MSTFEYRKNLILARYEELVTRPNIMLEGNGIYNRYQNPVVTADMVPPTWKYDFNPETNPWFMERIGCNATLNSGAIKWHGKYLLVVRIEGMDRKSFFAVAESPNGIDNFRFWEHPSRCPRQTTPPQMSMTCASPHMRTDGFTASSVSSARIPPSPATSRLPRHRAALPVHAISRPGTVCPT